MMTIEETIQVLMENRPERPYKTQGRRLQVAIDTAVEYIKNTEEQKKHEMLA